MEMYTTQNPSKVIKDLLKLAEQTKQVKFTRLAGSMEENTPKKPRGRPPKAAATPEATPAPPPVFSLVQMLLMGQSPAPQPATTKAEAPRPLPTPKIETPTKPKVQAAPPLPEPVAAIPEPTLVKPKRAPKRAEEEQPDSDSETEEPEKTISRSYETSPSRYETVYRKQGTKTQGIFAPAVGDVVSYCRAKGHGSSYRVVEGLVGKAVRVEALTYEGHLLDSAETVSQEQITEILRPISKD